MKRLLRSLLLGAILSALLCVGALAAESEPVKGGIYNIKSSNVQGSVFVNEKGQVVGLMQCRRRRISPTSIRRRRRTAA